MECKSSYLYLSPEDIINLSQFSADIDRVRIDAVDNYGRFQGYEVTIYGNIQKIIGNGYKLTGFKVDKDGQSAKRMLKARGTPADFMKD